MRAQRLIASQQNLASNIKICEDLLTSHGDRLKALATNWLPLLQKHQVAIAKLQYTASDANDVVSLLQA